jgi:hypothetical protein
LPTNENGSCQGETGICKNGICEPT